MPLRLDYLVGARISLAPSEANPQHESYSIRRNHGSKENNGNLAVYCSICSRYRRSARIAEGQGGKRPAVISLHERYGIDQHTKDLTGKLAQAGFVGLAPDLFHRFTGDRKAVLRGEQRVDLRDDEALEDLNAAVDYLKKSSNVDGSRIGIIGVCQTGRQPLLLAANRNDIAGAVVLYGAVGGREWLGNQLRPTPVE